MITNLPISSPPPGSTIIKLDPFAFVAKLFGANTFIITLKKEPNIILSTIEAKEGEFLKFNLRYINNTAKKRRIKLGKKLATYIMDEFGIRYNLVNSTGIAEKRWTYLKPGEEKEVSLIFPFPDIGATYLELRSLWKDNISEIFIGCWVKPIKRNLMN